MIEVPRTGDDITCDPGNGHGTLPERVSAVTRHHAVKGTKDIVMDARGMDEGLGVAQGGQGSSSGEAIRCAHDRAGATSHHEVESSKDDIAVVHNVGVDLNVAHGGDGSGGADVDGEADGAFGAPGEGVASDLDATRFPC